MSMYPYREAGKQALMSWNGLSEEEATKVVSEATFEELEGQVWAKSSMLYAVEGLASALGIHSENDKKVLAAVVLGGDEAEMSGKEEQVFAKLGAVAHEKGDVNAIILDVLSTIHDGWVKDNAKKFVKEGREGKKYQHLPLEAIGWKEAKADLLFLKPILDAAGVKYDEKELEEAYEARAHEFRVEHQWETPEGEMNTEKIAEDVIKGSEFYPALGEINSAKTKEEALLIAGQVESKFELIKY